MTSLSRRSGFGRRRRRKNRHHQSRIGPTQDRRWRKNSRHTQNRQTACRVTLSELASENARLSLVSSVSLTILAGAMTAVTRQLDPSGRGDPDRAGRRRGYSLEVPSSRPAREYSRMRSRPPDCWFGERRPPSFCLLRTCLVGGVDLSSVGCIRSRSAISRGHQLR